jgi:hypothetical protein
MKKDKIPGPKDTHKAKICRKTAIKKIGLTALSAGTMFLLLNEPSKAQDNPDSPANPPVWQ